MQRGPMIANPYRPGAGHSPPVIGGRKRELGHFRGLLRQSFVTENILVTGLRGFGKTVLVSKFRRMAEHEHWLWVGNDLSESASLTEERLSLRILADVADALYRFAATQKSRSKVVPMPGVTSTEEGQAATQAEYFDVLQRTYERTPGLASDKLKAALSTTLSIVANSDLCGLVLAYDEAQCLADHAQRNEFPMSMLVETVSSLQKRDGVTPCLLVLSGLPAVFDALIATRTYTERMFQVMELNRLSRSETAEALCEPLIALMPPLHPSRELMDKVVDLAGGYPYLIQLFGKELVDRLLENGGVLTADKFPDAQVLERLDAGLFAARWNKTTDKQRAFLRLIASRPPGVMRDFSAKELAELSEGEISSTQAGQMLLALTDRGLVYRSRHGRYAFTVPLSEVMILSRLKSSEDVEESWLESGTPDAAEPVLVNIGEPAPESTPKKRWAWFR
jgi:AAA ATPase domain